MSLRESARGRDRWRCRGERLTVTPGRTAVRRAGQGERAPGQQIPPRGDPVAAASPRSPRYLRGGDGGVWRRQPLLFRTAGSMAARLPYWQATCKITATHVSPSEIFFKSPIDNTLGALYRMCFLWNSWLGEAGSFAQGPKCWNENMFRSLRGPCCKALRTGQERSEPSRPVHRRGCAAGCGFPAPLARCGRSRSPFNSRLLPIAVVHNDRSRNFQVPHAELRCPSSGTLWKQSAPAHGVYLLRQQGCSLHSPTLLPQGKLWSPCGSVLRVWMLTFFLQCPKVSTSC